MIEIIDLGLIRNDKVILEKINWTINENEHWVLFGRNGCGKTRLLELITGYDWQTSGRIIRFGEEFSDLRELRKRIGYVSTILRHKFYHSERIIDVVLSGLFAHIGLYEPVNDDQITKAAGLLDLIGLGGRENHPFGIMSDGEKQKLLLARAFISNPRLIVFDEATMGLDLTAREDVLESITTLADQRGVSIIYVTHHVEEIISFFNQICILDAGKILYKGFISEGLSEERLSKLFNRQVSLFNHKGRYYTVV